PDNSVAGNDGTIVGSPDVKGNGKVGNSMFITDDGDGFIVPHKDSFNFSATDSYTLTAWIKADSFGGWRSIAAKNRDDSGSQYYGLFLNSNYLTFAMGVRTVDEVKAWPAISTKIEAGEWYQVVLVQDGEAGKSYIYLDGALVGTHDATYDYSGSTPWEIGGRFTAAKEYFKGGIDELKLYNIALEAEEIESEYKDQQAANPDFATYTGVWPTLEENEVPNVIFDSDLGGDCDDLGALAILYYYHQNGEINLVATTSCTSMWGAGGMSAINTYYGYPDMPMGFNGTKYSAHSSSAYGRYLSTHFSNPLVDKQEYESAVKVMRKALSEAEDNSITICAVGPYTNLYNLLCSSADEYSPLSGYDLVKQKVKWVLAMGCQYPSGKESNIAGNATAAKYINQNWPTPIVYSTWEIGNPIKTASRETLDRMDKNNPIREGYEEHFRNLKYGIPRPSWDPLTAYFTGAGYDEYYDLHRADVAIDGVGNSVFFDNETTGARAYLTKKDNVTNEQMAVVLDDLMVAAEGRIENGLYCDYFDDTDNRIVKSSSNSSTETVTHTFIGNEWYDTYYKSEDVGASIEVTFEGTSFTLYGGYLPTGGIVDIYLDGKLIDSVDTYKSSNYSSSHLYHKEGLSKSVHTLKLVTSDKKNSASSGNSFLFDFIKVDTFEVTLGDVNGDDFIDVCDLVKAQNIIDGKAPSFSAADLNSDGKIDSLDTAEIRKQIIT
ncbi:MAG: nucleoside hydrolase, partial [Clostridia bacterium]|nr:nucleoside hydrolase [Clostridia bacterium]